MARISYQNVTKEKAETAIRCYNIGRYRGRSNLELDSEGARMFEGGLRETEDGIREQVSWTGKEYGGSGNIHATRDLPSPIAHSIFAIRAEYDRQLLSAPILVDELFTRTLISTLFVPFQKQFGKARNWMTWATKFWHFLRPDSFPIMDSRAKRFFEIRANPDPINQYIQLAQLVQHTLQDKNDWLPMLRQTDEGQTESDIKLWDKVAFVFGAR